MRRVRPGRAARVRRLTPLGLAAGDRVVDARGRGRADPRFGPWRDLFDGETLGGFRVTGFAHDEEAWVDDGRIVLDLGITLSGVTWTEPFPTDGYELEVVAAKLDGNDFFCGLTFPVADGHCSLILGGWGGTLCGISCIDGEDASENATTTYRSFERGRDYRVRVRVDGARLLVHLDNELLYDFETEGHALTVRSEVIPSQPMGIASYATRAAIAQVRVRERRG